MLPDLYTRHAAWWPLLSAPAEYEEDARAYSALLREACVRTPTTVLEMGSGGGNNAFFMKQDFRMTLTDLSPAMLSVSQCLNPECEHIQGDMRTLRLGRVFDAVFIHDAIVYMTSLAELEQALTTAAVHCRAGGAALFVPDYTKETFRESTSHGGHDGPHRALRYLQWDHDPQPEDAMYSVDFAFLLREGTQPVRVEQETHGCGLFTITEWERALRRAGFQPSSAVLAAEDLEPGHYRVFIGRKTTPPPEKT